MHRYPLMLRSSQRLQSQQEAVQDPADKQAHATSGSAGGLEDVAPFTATSEDLGSQGKHHRTCMAEEGGVLPPALTWTLRGAGEVCWGGEVGSLEELNRSSQTAGVLAQEKDGNNSRRNGALHNKTRLRLLSDKASSTLEKYERLTDKQGRDDAAFNT